MKRGLAWLAGALGLAAVLRLQRRAARVFERPRFDPADELRARLEQARGDPDDLGEVDADAGRPSDEVEEPPSLEERRRAVHEQAQRAVAEMQRLDGK